MNTFFIIGFAIGLGIATGLWVFRQLGPVGDELVRLMHWATRKFFVMKTRIGLWWMHRKNANRTLG